MAKDFFDEEYDKIQQQGDGSQQQGDAFQSWANYTPINNPAPQKSGGDATKTRPLYIVLICLALALMFVFGWLMCFVFGGTSKSLSTKQQERYAMSIVNSLREQGIEITDKQLNAAIAVAGNKLQSGQIEQEAVLSSVLDYLHYNYYVEIPDNKWDAAVSAAGTALLQKAGDNYSKLMTPQEYYDYINQTDGITVDSSSEMFGIAYSYTAGLGIVVSSVVADGSCYGLLNSGDIIVKISQIQTKAGTPLTIDGVGTFSELALADCSSSVITVVMANMYSAKFHVLRHGEIIQTPTIERGKMGIDNLNPNYDYDFIEFYFSATHNNISTTNQNKAQHNTYELRGIANLPEDTGYICIKEFMYNLDSANRTVTAGDEFKKVMTLFNALNLKRLVLDLKGNPGGLIDAACDIAGLLITDQTLSAENKQTVNGVKQGEQLIAKLVLRDGVQNDVYTRKGSYLQYFAMPQNGVANIVIWTDGGSASASELLTGALLDYGTGFQIGSRTYGKGIAQTIEKLPYTGTIVTQIGTQQQSNWAIYYTFAAYYSPLGKNIHGIGYTPTEGYNNIQNYLPTEASSQTLWTVTKQYWGL